MSEHHEQKSVTVPIEPVLIAIRDEPLTAEQVSAAVKEDARHGVQAALAQLSQECRVHLGVDGRYHLSRKGSVEANQAAVHALLVAGGPRTIPQLMDDLKAERGVVEYACGLLVAHRLVCCEHSADAGGTVFRVL